MNGEQLEESDHDEFEFARDEGELYGEDHRAYQFFRIGYDQQVWRTRVPHSLPAFQNTFK